MTPEQFKALRGGDLIRHAATGKAWIVQSRTEDGDGVLLRRTQTAFNPPEWEMVAPLRETDTASEDDPGPTKAEFYGALDSAADRAVPGLTVYNSDPEPPKQSYAGRRLDGVAYDGRPEG